MDSSTIRKWVREESDLTVLARKFSDAQNVKALKKTNVSVLDELLLGLSPASQTLAFTELLALKSGFVDQKNTQEFVYLARQLFSDATVSHVALCAKSFVHIARKFREVFVNVERPLAAVGPLRQALYCICRALGSHAILTPIHSDLLYVAIKSKSYSAVQTIIETPLTQLAARQCGVDALDYLSYYYYSGVAFCALKNFSKACESFHLALSIPTTVISAIQIAAYKKYILAALLNHGEMPALHSKTISQLLVRSLDSLCSTYVEFSRSFKRGVDESRDFLEKNVNELKKDGNVGLVKQAIESLVRGRILRLTNTYVTLSLKQIADSCRLASVSAAEKALREMIALGVLCATIDQRAGMVRFDESDDKLYSRDWSNKLQAHIDQVSNINSAIKDKDRQLQLSNSYLQRTASELQKSEKSERSERHAMAGMGMLGIGGGLGLGGGIQMGMSGITAADDDLSAALARSLHEK